MLTFALQGFASVKKEGIELPSNFTATINGELGIGAVEETLTVSGAAPIVDVQSNVKSEVLSREVLDAVPTGRTIQGLAQLVTGVKMDAPDVGGAHAMQQTYISGHGMAASQTTVRLDGMMLNSMCGDGQVQFYQNTAIAEEMVYQTSGANADVSGAGISVNVIPKRGGNNFNGSVTGMGASGKWQANNLTQSLIDRGLKSTDKIDHNYDIEGGQGGRIVRDKLWFFVSARRISVNTPVADTFYSDGTQGVDDQYQQSVQLRMTWQMSEKNQITAYGDRVSKYRGHAMSAGYDPATAANVWLAPLYQAFESKWTSAVSNKLMIEAGFSSHQDRRQTIYEPGIAQPYESPLWFQYVNRNDLSAGTQTGAAPNENYTWPTRRYLSGTMTYVTGSHNIKAGVQENWGSQGFAYDANGDLRQQYQNGVPVSVVVMNTPVRYWANLNTDLGVFAQDSWTRKRLTVNYGARFRYLAIECAGGIEHARSFRPERLVRSSGHADIDDHRTARRRRLRSVWGRANRDQIQCGSLRAGRHVRSGQHLQSDRALHGHAQLDRPQPRRHRTGCSWLRVPHGWMRDEFRAVAEYLRNRQAGLLDAGNRWLDSLRHGTGRPGSQANLFAQLQPRRAASVDAESVVVGQLVPR